MEESTLEWIHVYHSLPFNYHLQPLVPTKPPLCKNLVGTEPQKLSDRQGVCQRRCQGRVYDKNVTL